MGLLIKATKEKKVIILGTEIELPSVYARLEFAGRADGVTLEIAAALYASKEAYKSGANAISTDVPSGNMTVTLEKGEAQSIESALKYGKQAYEEASYEVELV